MSQFDQWRDSSDYRRNYFDHNRGLFGRLWFCAYCFKPLWGHGSVQVDHIIAPSWFVNKSKRKKTGRNSSAMAEKVNQQEWILVSACPKCNREKSDKGGMYLVRGFRSKLIERVLMTTQDLATIGVWGGKQVIGGAASAVLPSSMQRPQKGPKKPALVSSGVLTTVLSALVFILSYVIFLAFKISWKAVWWYIKTMLRIVFYPIVGKKLSMKTRAFSVVVYISVIYFLKVRFFG